MIPDFFILHLISSDTESSLMWCHYMTEIILKKYYSLLLKEIMRNYTNYYDEKNSETKTF